MEKEKPITMPVFSVRDSMKSMEGRVAKKKVRHDSAEPSEWKIVCIITKMWLSPSQAVIVLCQERLLKYPDRTSTMLIPSNIS